MRQTILCVALFSASITLPTITACAQDSPPNSNAVQNTPQNLGIVETISPGTSSSALSPFRCDGDGNLYYRKATADPQVSVDKYDAKGRLQTSFAIVNTGIKDVVPYSFFVTKKGEVFQAAGIKGGHDTYVVSYSSDGQVASKTKLDIQDFAPYNLAVFPSGEYLIGGYQHPHHKGDAEYPLTALFDSSGKLVKNIQIKRDSSITDDSQPSQPVTGVNLAVAAGQVGVADDGNAYLLRNTDPALIYGVSAAGELVRTITVKSDLLGALPYSMLVSGNDAAILFSLKDTNETELRIIDLTTGDTKAVLKPVAQLGRQLACANPPDFTFLSAKDGQRIIYRAAPQ